MKRSKLEIIFLVISFIFIGGLIITYSARGIYYYLKENGNKEVIKSDLSSIILNKINKDNIYYKDNKYNIIGNVENNYVFYSGILWRVISLDENTIQVITDDSITLLPNNNKLVNTWLKDNVGEFTKYETLLSKNKTCDDSFDNIENISCSNKIEDYMTLLSAEQYKLIGGANSYVNNNKYWWLSNTDTSNNSWYVKDDGELNSDSLNHIYGVRPVVTINNIEYIYGNGSQDNPYIISNDAANSLYEAELGSYINYSNYVFKIVSKQNGIKLVMVNPLTINGLELTKKYSNKNNYFNLSDITNIAYYLNNTFYNTLDKKYLNKGDYNMGTYDNYAYEELYNNKINSYIGLLNVGDLFLNENDNMYLLSENTNDLKTISILKENDTLYYDFVTYESLIKPVIYLNGNIEIANGIGNSNYPYELR